MTFADSPFVLLAHVHVKPDCVDQYLEIAATVDKAVEDSEPGMLLHTFDIDPDDPCAFTWTEVYQNDAALLAHLQNPPVGEYLKAHAELGDGFTVEIYGNLAEATIEAVNALGIPWKHHRTSHVGYIRRSLY